MSLQNEKIYNTEDLVGNKEEIHKVTLGFDRNGPEVSHEIEGDQYIKDGKVYLSWLIFLMMT